MLEELQRRELGGVARFIGRLPMAAVDVHGAARSRGELLAFAGRALDEVAG